MHFIPDCWNCCATSRSSYNNDNTNEICDEKLFDPNYFINNIEESLTHAILSTIQSMPIDIRKHVIQNIVILDHNSMQQKQQHFPKEIFLNGLKEGIEIWDYKFISLKPLLNSISIDNVRSSSPFANYLQSWIGASVMCSSRSNSIDKNALDYCNTNICRKEEDWITSYNQI